MSQLSIETGDSFATLLELAANNDIDGFTQSIDSDPSGIDEVGLWYGRQKGSKQMVLEHRTPLMVAAMYGSIDVLKLILSQSKVDVNRLCGVDKTTALHCAASGGSVNAIEVIKLLLINGADPNLIDVNGLRPVDMIVVSPKLPEMKKTLEELLGANGDPSVFDPPSPENRSPENQSPESDPDLLSSRRFQHLTRKGNTRLTRHYPTSKTAFIQRMSSGCIHLRSVRVPGPTPMIGPSARLSTRAKRATTGPAKVPLQLRPVSRLPKGTCRRGDMCEYAHGVFECWLHPAHRTRLCKDGTGCNRRVCFFAHTQEELRPLFVSTGSAVPSPRSSSSGPSALDFAAAMSLMPGPLSSFTPPMSPSGNGMSNMNWPQPNVPSLHLPGSNLQSSRLRSSLNARDMSDQDLNLQLLNELSRQQRQSILTPTKLDDIFAAESSSPRFSDQSVFSPRHNSAVFNQFQQQQSMLSPINTNFSPKNTSFAVQNSPGRMSPRSVDPISPMSSRVSMLARENQQQFRSLSSRELGSRSGSIMGGSVDPWSKWGSSEQADWGVNVDEFGKLRRSSSFENGGNNGEEPDLSWVQSLVKETPQEMKEKLAAYGGSGGGGGSSGGGGGGVSSNTQIEQMDQSALSAWIEQMQLDQLVAQQN